MGISDQLEKHRLFRRLIIIWAMAIFTFVILDGFEYIKLDKVLDGDLNQVVLLLGVFTVPTAGLVRYLFKDYSESKKQ